MSRVTLFKNPFMLGFDQFDSMLDELSKSADDNYPPYNIEQIGDKQLQITVAVAGFCEKDINAYIENNKLIIKGKIEDKPDKNTIYLHRGIATRQFQKVFLLADGMELVNAKLSCGLLKISLERIQPEVTIRQIKIVTEE